MRVSFQKPYPNCRELNFNLTSYTDTNFFLSCMSIMSLTCHSDFVSLLQILPQFVSRYLVADISDNENVGIME